MASNIRSVKDHHTATGMDRRRSRALTDFNQSVTPEPFDIPEVMEFLPSQSRHDGALGVHGIHEEY